MMKNLVYLTLFFTLFVSCTNDKQTTAVNLEIDTTATIVNALSPVGKDSIVPETTPVKGILQKVTYISATYYTGRVDFYFKDEKGKRVEVSINNFPEDKRAKYPSSLLESGEHLEGPPGENPAMVGKQFYLVKNAAGDLIEIRAAN